MLKILFVSIALFFAVINSRAAQAATFKEAYQRYNESISAENYIDAVTHAKQAFELGVDIYGANSESAINLEYNLGLAYSSNKQTELAFETLASVAVKFSQLSGENSVNRFNALFDQIITAHQYKMSGLEDKRSDYRAVINDALNIVDDVSEEKIHGQAIMYYELGIALAKTPLSTSFFNKAFATLKKAEEALLASVGEKDSRTIEIQFVLAKYNRAKNYKTRAIKYYEHVIAIIDDSIDTSHPYELASRAALVDLYERKGQTEEATQHCVAIGHMTPWNDNLEPTPLFRKNPEYPLSAARRNVNGWVVLSFDISKTGFVKNIAMLEENGGNSFVKESIEAVEKWRYAPKIVDGKAVVAKNNKVRLDFTMSKS